jgi:predicted nucleotide-binding protein (sugar kinase/HSP70/actin superfamily)
MDFVPYLIYNDIIDISSYNNKKTLHKRIQTPIDILKIWNSNGIINKRWYIVNKSNKDLITTKGFIANFELKIIDFIE